MNTMLAPHDEQGNAKIIIIIIKKANKKQANKQTK
jgi:hypothetical protein